MDSNVVIEGIGYLGSALIVLSILQKSLLRLRVVGFLGGITFLIYSLAIEAYPIAVVNVVGASIHAWYLRKLIRRKAELFRTLLVDPDSKYLHDFLDFYKTEIAKYQPDFVYQPNENDVTAFILRDMVPAGLFIGETREDNTFEIKLDFVIPQYRDFRIGSYVYAPGSYLLSGIEPSCIWATATNDGHAKYLKRMGFSECPDLPGRFEIQCTPRPASAFERTAS